jgi:hypothetical protein
MLLCDSFPLFYLYYTTPTSLTFLHSLPRLHPSNTNSTHPSSTLSVTSTPTPSSNPYIQDAGGLHAVSNKAANPKKPKTKKTHIHDRKKKKTLRRAMDRDAPSHLYAGSGYNVVRRR